VRDRTKRKRFKRKVGKKTKGRISGRERGFTPETMGVKTKAEGEGRQRKLLALPITVGKPEGRNAGQKRKIPKGRHTQKLYASS